MIYNGRIQRFVTEVSSKVMSIKKDFQKESLPIIIIIDFHPSDSVPDSHTMMNLLSQDNYLKSKEFVRGVYDIYEGNRYVGRYCDLSENKNLAYIYKCFPDENQQKFLMMQEIRIRLFEDLWFPHMYNNKTLKIKKTLKKD